MRSLTPIGALLVASCALDLGGLGSNGVEPPANDGGGIDSDTMGPEGDAGDVDGAPTSEDAGVARDGATILDATPPPATAIPADCGSTTLFAHGFEDSLDGPWTGIYTMTGDDVTHSSSQAFAGRYAARCETDDRSRAQATMYLDFPHTNRIYVSMRVYLDSGFAPSDYVKLIAVVNDDSSWTNVATVNVYPDMTVGARNAVTDVTHRTGAVVTGDAWHRIELWVRVSDVDGALVLAVDGVTALDLRGLDTGSLLVHRVLTGIAWQGRDTDRTRVYVDDVTLDSTCGG